MIASTHCPLRIGRHCLHHWRRAGPPRLGMGGAIEFRADRRDQVGKARQSAGLLKVSAKREGKEEEWTVEVGQPWRNERAGLKDSMLVKSVELTIQGNRAKDPKLKVVKAARVIINGKTYNLYPERVA